MGKTPLSKESQFIVGEEKVLDLIMAVLFFGIFLYGLIDAILLHLPRINYVSFISVAALVPAIFYYRKGKNKRIYIRINKKGIYQDEQLVTDWSNFLNAYISQKKPVMGPGISGSTNPIQDNFILVLEYLKEGQTQGFRRKIPLTNTQNKSEEEIMAAVNFFLKENKGVTFYYK